MQPTEHNYKLTTPFKYARIETGMEEEATYVVLTAPTTRHMAQCARMKQEYFGACQEIYRMAEAAAARRMLAAGGVEAVVDEDGKEVADPSDEFTADTITGDLERSREVRHDEVLSWFMEMAVTLDPNRPGIAVADGVVHMTQPMLDSMSYHDLESMASEYMATFTLASAWQKLKTNGSEQ